MGIWVDDLIYYPIKSLGGNHAKQTKITQQGIWQDRRYLLVDDKGNFITARKQPKLCLLKVLPRSSVHSQNVVWEVTPPQETMSKESHSPLTPLVIDPRDFKNGYGKVSIWKSDVVAQFCGEIYDQWFTEYLGKPARLVWFSDQSQRQSPQKGLTPSAPVAFADAYPLLVVSRASLRALQAMCPETVEMRQFRPNIVIDGCDAFEEDTWETFNIGNVRFQSAIPCVRCIFTTLNPNTAEPSPTGEPLKTLSQHRTWMVENKKKGPIFGMNVIAMHSGTLDHGAAVEVLSYRQAPSLF